ncbi:hydroxymethylglutaryl-CoA lyase [Desulfobulbus sp.]|uniref:hydroxymethylglutaryl-CoA lyase n=1 Tax=Desulfobulbus sp. TaxID=895 RepID=UPI00286ED561|nr:hydroxymethylglutaryl-CoA lyase [Desulfobulbus sp.]
MRVVLQEEALGDGLQGESRLFGLAEKLEIVRLLAAAGVRRLQLGSFVNPRSVPQVANTDVLVSLVRRQYPDIQCTAQVHNEKGVERALRSGLEHLAVIVPVSESDSRKHDGRSMAEVMKAATQLIAAATAEGIDIRAGLRCAFGCIYEGGIPETVVLDTVGQLVDAGAGEINLADTAGMAHPHQVKHLAAKVRERYPETELSLHLHDTRGLGLVNLYAGFEAGVRGFDVAVGGLGGCPFIEGAAGNVATEDAVHLFEGMGVATGLDLGGLCRAAEAIETLLERRLPGRICRAQHTPE